MYAMDAMCMYSLIHAIDSMWIYNMQDIYNAIGTMDLIEAMWIYNIHSINNTICHIACFRKVLPLTVICA